jgi:UDP-2,4-diacetamido-2,4,6-trideoxy-beta-L-altropyranose hydrolase
MRRALFRLDAGRTIGLGHMLRCLALADELAARGWACRFAVNPGAGALAAAVRPVAHEVVEDGGFDDAPRLAAIAADGCDVLIVDSYRLESGFESACRSFAPRIVAIDDLADRPHDADLIADPASGRSPADYAGRAPGARILTGAAYALLAPEFARARPQALRRRLDAAHPARRILIALGGAPPAALLQRLIAAARRGAPDVALDVAAGASDIADVADPKVRIHRGRVDVAALTADADLAIGAGGSSSWERCCLGLPTLLVEIADNQRATIAALADAGAGRAAGRLEKLDEEKLARAVAQLAADGPALKDMARRAALLCDGLGAARLANEIEALFDARAPRVTLRPATSADGEIMLAWQSAPGARRFANNPTVPERAEHAAWLSRRLADPLAGPFEIIEADGAPAGVLRFDRIDGAAESCRVSILVAAEAQGQGVARRALAAGGRLLPGATLIAEVKAANAPSRALFVGAGYEQIEPELFRRPPLPGV